MNLEDILNGSRVCVDANVILYALHHRSPSCRRFLARCASRAVEGVLTTIAVAEVAHRRMIEEARAKGLTGANPARLLSSRPELTRQLHVYADDIRDLLAGEFIIEAVRTEDFYVALELQAQYGLLTNDSLNLAAAKRIGIQDIATADKSFDNVPGLILYRPADIVV